MDLYIRGISEKHNSKVAIVDITNGFKEIINLQKPNPIAATALGRTIIDTILISLSLKNEEKINVNISGMGLLGNITAEYQNKTFRGYVMNPNFDIKKIEDGEDYPSSLSQAVGKNGFIQVARYNKDSNEPYISRCELLTGEINIDFMNYIQQSEQIHTLITSKITFDKDMNFVKAAGIIIQLLPNSTEEDIDFIEDKIGTLENLNEVIEKSTNYNALLENIFDDFKQLDTQEIKFECTCDNDKVMKTISILPENELDEIILKGEALEIICEFCKKKYVVDVSEIIILKKEKQELNN